MDKLLKHIFLQWNARRNSLSFLSKAHSLSRHRIWLFMNFALSTHSREFLLLVDLVLETHPSDRTQNNYGHKDDCQDSSQRYHRAFIGRSGYSSNHIVDWGNKIDTNDYANHNTNKSCYVQLSKPPVKLKQQK